VIDQSLYGFLSESLDVLERESSAGYAAVVRALDRREVSIDMDGERLAIAGDDRRVHVRRTSVSTRAAVTLGRKVLSDLLAARTTLLDAALDDRLDLRGALPDVLAFHDALVAYLAGAARCPSILPLLGTFLEEP
jgi:hypothetical protein